MTEPTDETPTAENRTSPVVDPSDVPTELAPLPPATVDLDVFGRPAPPGKDWAHRRGEPRIFAFFWTLYLLFATVGAFWAVGAPGGHDALAMRPAARSLLAAITIGIALLWPMTRLSQTAPSGVPRRVAKAILQDMMVLLVPAQAVIWPQIAMAAWPVPVVGALAASLAAWTLVIGGVLAVALTISRGRAWWMLLIVAMAGLGPLVVLGPLGNVSHGDGTFDWWWMTSPITSGFEISRDRLWTGAAAAVAPGHWRAIGTVAAIGLVVWTMFGILGLFRRVESA